ncbi:PREDICTED: cytoplasmic tRNA 2-thiolation protein 2 [Drosophila arizonae]|uniref:Cytoplasmic tRNA 2-thiolation protein 2 n=1 Tax=Drosophila arizonae TaxID=7263 RepID=A0ABM1NZ14_DROAR|nr:PREDICTED: cytoplasmic tRNA 2-thiolation protein 2 [Drosophila arizonae]
MCSIGEDDFGDEGGTHAMLPSCSETGIVLRAGNCSKCGQNSQQLYKLNFRSAECSECFLKYVRHKFRAALGAAKVLPRNAEILLVIDGSSESLVLLDMVHFAQTQNTFKRLHCNARVLYVDAHCAPIKEEESPLLALSGLQRRYEPFEFYVIQLNGDPQSLQLLKDYTVRQLDSILDQFNSSTSRQDYMQQKRKFLVGGVAMKLKCSHVFEPSISPSLATQLLTSVALGRGASVALDVALLDDRLMGDVKLLRPLKDLNDQEVQFYVHAKELQAFRVHDPSHYPLSSSLQSLTRDFVANLQLNYASTVSTVFRTGDKIAPKRNSEEILASYCALCQSLLDNNVSDTLLAIEYSRAVSEVGVELKMKSSCDVLEQRVLERLKEREELCHACRNIQAELSSGTLI